VNTYTKHEIWQCIQGDIKNVTSQYNGNLPAFSHITNATSIKHTPSLQYFLVLVLTHFILLNNNNLTNIMTNSDNEK